MKLTFLNINDRANSSPVRFDPFHPALNFLYDESGSQKANLRQQVSGLILTARERASESQIAASTNHTVAGWSVGVSARGHEWTLAAGDAAAGSTVSVIPKLAGSTNGAVHPFSSASRSVANATIESLSSINFCDHQNELRRLVNRLHTDLQIPLGVEALGDAGDGAATLALISSLSEKLAMLAVDLERAASQRTVLNQQLESVVSVDQHRRQELEQKIAATTLALQTIDPATLASEMATISSQIESLRQQIAASQVRVVPQASGPDVSALTQLYARLDDCDDELRRWRTMQDQLQHHRMSRKNEIVALNQLTLESQDHPYHNARLLLRDLESRINQTQDQSQQWLEAHGPVDSRQSLHYVSDACQHMRDSLAALCDELSGQYQQLQHRSAAIHLRELRETHAGVGKHIEELHQLRERLLAQVREFDPTFSQALASADSALLTLAMQSGYRVAREQTLGPLKSQQVTAPAVVDTSLQQAQIDGLTARQGLLQNELNQSDVRRRSLTEDLTRLTTERDQFVSTPAIEQRNRLGELDREINSLNQQRSSIQIQIDELRSRPARVANPILKSAAGWLTRLTGGELTTAWFDRSTTESNSQAVMVKDSAGAVRAATSTDADQQRLTLLALILAGRQSLATGEELCLPLMLDDLFLELASQRVTPVLKTVDEFAQQTGQQVLILTRHRFLSDRLPAAGTFALPQHFQVTATTIPVPSSGAPIAPAIGTSPVVIKPHDLAEAAPPIRFATRRDASITNGLPRVAVPVIPPANSFEPIVYSHAAHSSHETIHPRGSYRTTRSIDASDVGDRYDALPMLSDDSPIHASQLFSGSQLRCLDRHKITNVSQFLQVAESDINDDWHETGLTFARVSRIQDALWLLSRVPDLNPVEASVLVSCGISDPQHLATSDAGQLFERLNRFLRSTEGRPFVDRLGPLDRARIVAWQTGLNSYRDRSSRQQNQNRSSSLPPRSFRTYPYRNESEGRSSRRERRDDDRSSRPRRDEREGFGAVSRSRNGRSDRSRSSDNAAERSYSMQSDRTSRPRADRQRSDYERDSYDRPERDRDRREQHDREPRVAGPVESGSKDLARRPRTSKEEKTNGKPAALRQTARKTATGKLKFYLDLSDHIEAAPSIGPKTAERFEKIGVYTIADFLKLTAESMAQKLDYRRMSADVLRSWQHQARLVCRIPNLRGHDAQLLVGCDVIEAEELSSMQPQELFQRVEPFADSKEGMKIIRNGKKPDLEEITDWISFAQHNRSLQAA